MAKRSGEQYPAAGASPIGRASSRLTRGCSVVLPSFNPDLDQHDAAIVAQATRYSVTAFWGSGIYTTDLHATLELACAFAPLTAQLGRGVMIYALDARDRHVLMATYSQRDGLARVWPPKSKDEIAAEKAARKQRWAR